MGNMVLNPIAFFTDLLGKPLQGGSVYIGAANTNPVTNPLTVYQDAAMTIPMAQPLKTANGYVSLNGSPQPIYVNAPSYSLAVNDSNGNLTLSLANYTNPLQNQTGAGGASQIGFDGTTLDQQFLSRVNRVVDSIVVLRALSHLTYTRAFVTGYYAAGDGGGGPYWYDPTDTTSADNGGTIIVAADGGRWKLESIVPPTIAQFGAKTDGSDSAPFIQSAINAGVQALDIFKGDYTISTTITPPTSVFELRGTHAARLLAGVNNLTFIKSTASAYYFRISGVLFHGNGKTGVVAMDMTGMRLFSGVIDCKFQLLNTGFIGRDGCFGLHIRNLSTEAVPNPVLFINNNSGTIVDNPNFDNGTGVGGDGTGTGVAIQGTNTNLGAVIRGGYIQGFADGVIDNGIGTVIRDIYFENCTDADIWANSGGRNGRYQSVSHWGNVGAAAYKLRSPDAVSIINPVMGSGARTKLVDDPTLSATNSVLDLRNSNASYNTPLGDVSHLGLMASQLPVTFTPVVQGSSTTGTGTYTLQSATAVRTGNQVHVQIAVAWTAHTGTGNLIITGIPANLAPASFTIRRFGQVSMNGFAFTGPLITAYLNGTGTQISISQTSTSGAESNIGLPSTATIYISMTYDL